MKKIIAILCCMLLMFAVGCGNQQSFSPDDSTQASSNNGTNSAEPFESTEAQELSKRFSAQGVDTLTVDDKFSTCYNELAVKLIKQAYIQEKTQANALISPLSIELAFSVLTNGAVGTTKSELEESLFGMDIETLNKYNKAYVANIPSSKDFSLNVANSIWLKNDEDLSVKDRFLQTNANYYNAQVYSTPFNNLTLSEINSWISSKTNGMIKNALERIDPETVFFIINAICMEAKWEDPFMEYQIRTDNFYNLDGSTAKVEMMNNEEHIYLSGEKATGFMKTYEGGRYAFSALLPNEDVNINDFVASLDGETLTNYFKSIYERVIINMPKMKIEYSLRLVDLLKSFGVNEVFEPANANLTDLATYKNANIFVSNAIHKTFMEVDNAGTRAAAVTIIAGDTATAVPNKPKYVTLNRPFVYSIVDMQTNTPIFIGVQIAF